MMKDKWIFMMIPIIIIVEVFIINKIIDVSQNEENKHKLDYVKYIELLLYIIFSSGTSYALLKHTYIQKHLDKLIIVFIILCVIGFWIFQYRNIITGSIKDLEKEIVIIKPTTSISSKLNYLFQDQKFSLIPSIFRFKKSIYSYNYNFEQEYPVNKLSPQFKDPKYIYVNSIQSDNLDLVNLKDYEVKFMKSK